jgi:hypothetical protein
VHTAGNFDRFLIGRSQARREETNDTCGVLIPIATQLCDSFDTANGPPVASEALDAEDGAALVLPRSQPTAAVVTR